MCLYTKQICPIRARRDIEVYKVLRYDSVTDKIITPYTHFPVLTKTMDVSEESIRRGMFFVHIVGKGMIHSYNYCPALAGYSQTFFLVKAVIPKGALYYRGLCNDYASKKLILKDIVGMHPMFHVFIERAYENLSESR